MRDPLALDAGLVVFGTTLAILTGAMLYADGGRPVVPVVAVGVAVTLVAAGLVWLFRDRLSALGQYVAGPTETPRERARFVLPIAGLVLIRLFVLPLLPPVTVHAFFGAAATMAGLGAGRALTRGLSG